MGHGRSIIVWRIPLLFLVSGFLSLSLLAQSGTTRPQPSPTPNGALLEQSGQSKQEPEQPIEHSDQFKSKLTLGGYFTPGAGVYDLNLRHEVGPLTAWIAGFYDLHSNKLLRVGSQCVSKNAGF